MKSALIEFLKRYDFSLLDGGQGGPKGVNEGGKRPPSIAMGAGFIVNPGSKVWIRERKN